MGSNKYGVRRLVLDFASYVGMVERGEILSTTDSLESFIRGWIENGNVIKESRGKYELYIQALAVVLANIGLRDGPVVIVSDDPDDDGSSWEVPAFITPEYWDEQVSRVRKQRRASRLRRA